MSWNFALILFVLLVLTGIIWALDLAVLRRGRERRAQEAMAQYDAALIGDSQEAERLRREAGDKARRVPWWIEYAVSFFPVILFVFVLRSFVVEPFRIPSGSMLPTLQSGDLILVNKFSYGLRLPVIDKKVVDIGKPQRGDVFVFRYPVDPDVDYIKRVIGVPGDEVAYLNKQLTVNGKPVPRVAQPDFFDSDSMRYSKQFGETLDQRKYSTLNDDDRPAFIPGATEFPFADGCKYTVEGVSCKVPAGHYFMMGDNRDNSLDSRYWGFVPERNIVGKAFFVWMNFGDLGRIGSFE